MLADKGFNITDLIEQRGGKLITPAYLKSRKNFNFDEEALGRITCRARVFIECFNERFKNFLIVNGIVPHHMYPLLSQLVFVACCFANFTDVLCK